MYLGQVILLSCVGAVLLMAPMAWHAHRYWPRHVHDDRLGVALCAYMLLLFWLLMGLRSVGFGVDTAAYAGFFQKFCGPSAHGDEELSFFVAAGLLNAAMGGVCRVDLLTGAWVMLLIVGLMSLREDAVLRLQLAVLLLFSMIGIELATNALRQGFSVVFMLMGLSAVRTHLGRALIFLGLSLALHSSSALVLFCLGLARLGWRAMLLLLLLLSVLVYVFVDTGLEIFLIGAFLFEIQKYLAHDADEIWIRVLSYACVLGCFGVLIWRLLVSRVSAVKGRWAACRQALLLPDIAQAFKLGVMCLPFLLLPYFGYRFVYGIYPVVIYLVLRGGGSAGINVWKLFYVIFSVNIVVVMVWLQGSSYMREVRFFE